jgi:hypothetical protein
MAEDLWRDGLAIYSVHLTQVTAARVWCWKIIYITRSRRSSLYNSLGLLADPCIQEYRGVQRNGTRLLGLHIGLGQSRLFNAVIVAGAAVVS